MQSIEKTGETVEAAIAAGLEELGVTAADVMVEVLDEPSRGIMGIGARPARVRLVVMMSRQAPPPPAPAPAPAAPEKPAAPRTQEPSRSSESSRSSDSSRSSESSRNQEPREARKPRRDRSAAPAASNAGDGQSFDYEVEDDIAAPQGDEISDEDADDVARTGKEVLGELLQRMSISGRINIHRAESTREGEDMHWILNITGKQIGRLIGRRGETLAALQYVVRLIISRRLQTRANIIVDAGSYKANRSDRLKQLAHRMADQALSQGRTITLEPMPPHERRIVHLALRTREEVTTKSIGEGDSRKVTISPVK